MTLDEGDIVSLTPNCMKSTTGQEYEVDVIICATGFDHSFHPYFPIIGRGDKSLRETFMPQPEAYLALTAHGYPNFLSMLHQLL
jgi:cation diffusion facilitator CzcD-associated flavoprotein CzcO